MRVLICALVSVTANARLSHNQNVECASDACNFHSSSLLQHSFPSKVSDLFEHASQGDKWVVEDSLASFSAQRTPPASAAEAVELLKKEAGLVAAFIASKRVSEVAEVHEKAALLAKSQALRNGSCVDDDACLADRWWGDFQCQSSTAWCESWADDMNACCPMSCGTCPDPAPEAAPFQPFSPPPGNKLFFSMPATAEIYTMSLNGTHLGTFIASGAPCPNVAGTARALEAVAMMGRPESVAVDAVSNVIFWSDWLGGTADANQVTYNASVLSSPADGPQIIPVATSAFYRPPPEHPDGILGCDGYSTYNCPPASIHDDAGGYLPITHLDSPAGLSVDPVEKMLYWSDRAHQGGQSGGPQYPKVQRASYDGFTNLPEDFFVDGMIGETVATAIDYRPGHRKIYWIEDVNMRMSSTGAFSFGSEIRRASLDGTGMEVLASWLTRAPIGLALDLVNEKFYWTEYLGGRIQRCPLDGCPPGDWDIGSTPEDVLIAFGDGTFSYTSPKLGGIALDPANEMMYWTEDHTSEPPPGEGIMIWGGMVKAAKFDGTDVRELYRHTARNEHYKATPFGISIVLEERA